MDRTKSEFRALRETVGMTQADVARMVGVDPRSVRRWESPENEWTPPRDAWDVLDAARERQKKVVRFAVEKVAGIERSAGHAPSSVRIPYWLNESSFKEAHPDDSGTWQMANANSRIVAAMLEHMGRNVEWADGRCGRLSSAE